MKTRTLDRMPPHALEEIARLKAENKALREALRIIAGIKQALDNTMSNQDIANLALLEADDES